MDKFEKSSHLRHYPWEGSPPYVHEPIKVTWYVIQEIEKIVEKRGQTKFFSFFLSEVDVHFSGWTESILQLAKELEKCGIVHKIKDGILNLERSLKIEIDVAEFRKNMNELICLFLKHFTFPMSEVFFTNFGENFNNWRSKKNDGQMSEVFEKTKDINWDYLGKLGDATSRLITFLDGYFSTEIQPLGKADEYQEILKDLEEIIQDAAYDRISDEFPKPFETLSQLEATKDLWHIKRLALCEYCTFLIRISKYFGRREIPSLASIEIMLVAPQREMSDNVIKIAKEPENWDKPWPKGLKAENFTLRFLNGVDIVIEARFESSREVMDGPDSH